MLVHKQQRVNVKEEEAGNSQIVEFNQFCYFKVFR